MDAQYIEVELEPGVLFAGDSFFLSKPYKFQVEIDVARYPFSDEEIDKRYKTIHLQLLDNPFHKVVDGKITHDAIIKCKEI